MRPAHVHLPKDHQPRLLGLGGSSVAAVTSASGCGSGLGSGPGFTVDSGAVIPPADVGSDTVTGGSAAPSGPTSLGSAFVALTLVVRFLGARRFGAGLGVDSSGVCATSAASVFAFAAFSETS